MKPNRPATRFLFLLALVIVWFGYGAGQIEKWRFYHFRQDRWSTAESSDRWYMAKYLVDKELLIGKTKDQIIDLLGPTEDDALPQMNYNLGSERASMFAIDDDWLELTFGGTDRSNLVVVTARIRPD